MPDEYPIKRLFVLCIVNRFFIVDFLGFLLSDYSRCNANIITYQYNYNSANSGKK